MSDGARILLDALASLQLAAAFLAISVLLFGLIALLVEGREAVNAAVRAVAEVRLNLGFYFLGCVIRAARVDRLIAWIQHVVGTYSLALAERAVLDGGKPVGHIRRGSVLR